MKNKVNTIELSALVADTILSFCENLAELGCPREEKEPDMWFRNMSTKKQQEVAEKLIDIVERDINRFKEEYDQIENAKKVKNENKKRIRK